MTRDPAFAAEGMRKYADLNTIAASLVKPGGLFVTASCSGLVSLETFEECVIKGVHRLNRRLQIFDRTGPGSTIRSTRIASRAATSSCSGRGWCEPGEVASSENQ